MGRVYDRRGVGRDNFDSAAQLRVSEGIDHPILRERPAIRLEALPCCNSDSRVVCLMFARHSQGEVSHLSCWDSCRNWTEIHLACAVGSWIDGDGWFHFIGLSGTFVIDTEFPKRAICFDALCSNNRSCVRMPCAANNRYIFFDDPGFFAGNERDRISQLLLVVKADRGDDGKCAVTDVCAVKPSAEANLDHIDV